jgi:hypothetical protein
MAQELTNNIDKIIDITFYPIDKARNCSLAQRAIGIG